MYTKNISKTAALDQTASGGGTGDSSCGKLSYFKLEWSGLEQNKQAYIVATNLSTSGYKCFGVSTSLGNDVCRSQRTTNYINGNGVYTSSPGATANITGTFNVHFRYQNTNTYNLNGGSGISTSQTTYAGIGFNLYGTPTRTGYTFGGWKEGNGSIWEAGKTFPDDWSDGSKTFVAQWNPIIYKITFDDCDGLRDIRYIKDTLVNGSSANGSNHWTELKAFGTDGVNYAASSRGASSKNSGGVSTTAGLLNEVLGIEEWKITGMSGDGTMYQMVDLGQYRSIKEIVVWHYGYDSRTYNDNTLQVSRDGTNWSTIFSTAENGKYTEDSTNGHKVSVWQNSDKIRYIKDTLSGGNSVNGGHYWIELKAFGIEGINYAASSRGATSKNSDGVSTTANLLNENIGENEWRGDGMSGPNYQLVDLGKLRAIDEIVVWHYGYDGRTFNNNILEVSTDGVNWRTIFSTSEMGTYAENKDSGHTAGVIYKQKTIPFGNSYGGMPTPNKANYNFVGWYTSASGGTKVSSSTTYNTVGNQVLYAHWELATYKLTIYFYSSVTNATNLGISASGCTVGNASIGANGNTFVSHTYSATSSYTITFTRASTSYNYYLKAGGVPTTSSDTNSTTYSWTPTGNSSINVYAYERYSINFNLNSGSGTLPSTVYKIHGTSATIPTNTLTRTSYTANGWNTNSSGSGTNYTTLYSSNANITLYANWTPKYSTIKVQIMTSDSKDSNGKDVYVNSINGGTILVSYYSSSNNNPSSSSSSVTTASLTTISSTVLINYNVTFTPVTKTGYVYMGISASSSGPVETSGTPNSVFVPNSQNSTYTIYVYFNMLSTNKLKYDALEKYFYFEDGEYPQSYVGDSMNTTLTNGISEGTPPTYNLPYNNGFENVNIPVYTYGGQKYAKVNTMQDNNLEWAATGSNYYTLSKNLKYINAITVNLWGYMTNWATYGNNNMRMISCTEGGGWNIESSGGNIAFAIYDSGVGYKSINTTKSWSSLSSGWHMFTLTFDGNYARGYVDGNLIETSAKFTSGKIGYNTTNAIFVGAEAGSSDTIPVGAYFSEKIKNIRILNSGILTEQVKELYLTGSFSKWFKVEPIRWRVSDYGVSSTQYPSGWSNYGTYKENFVAVSDKVLGFGSFHDSEVFEDWSFDESKLFSVTSSNVNKISNRFNALNVSTEIDYFGKNGQQEKVKTKNINYTGTQVTSVKDINANLTDKRAKASDMVAFYFGLNDGDYVDYWTRNLGDNLNNGLVVTKSGVTTSKFLNSISGVRLSLVFAEGSRI